ncbi:hypothetical protein [Homoserinimonas sp. A520]
MATLALTVAFGGVGASAAWADETPPPTSTPSATPPPEELQPASAVTITSHADDDFLPSNAATVSGKKSAGSSVVVTAGGNTFCSMPVTDPASTDWGCSGTLPNGSDLTLTATETLADDSTSQATVTVHVLGPPTLTPTSPQETRGVASGTGYPGSAITLFVNGAAQSCNALVAPNGKWICTIAGGPGEYDVQAEQTTMMGGFGRTSNPSSQVTIVVNPGPPTATPAPVIPPPAPIRPPSAPVVPEEPAPTPTPSQTPDERADSGTLPWLDRPIFPGPGGEGPTAREALTNWGTSTGFGSRLPTPQETVTTGNWLWAPLLAIAFIGLIALPLRLLATTLRGRFTFRKPQFAGRNRGAVVAEEPVPRNPWLMGAVPLAATAGLIVLAQGLNGEVRYLRLLFAVGAGLAILNVVGVAIATRFASRGQGVTGRLRFLPLLLLIAAIATVLARVTGMETPLVGGVLIGVGFALSVPARPRALVNLAQVGGVLALAMVAWPLHSLMGTVEGFWASVLYEMLATVSLAGLGSALILMLPIGALPGRVVLEWSPKAWFAATLVVGTVAAAVLLGGIQPTFPMLATLLTVIGFAAVCVAVWAWTNYVEVSRV